MKLTACVMSLTYYVEIIMDTRIINGIFLLLLMEWTVTRTDVCGRLIKPRIKVLHG